MKCFFFFQWRHSPVPWKALVRPSRLCRAPQKTCDGTPRANGPDSQWWEKGRACSAGFQGVFPGIGWLTICNQAPETSLPPSPPNTPCSLVAGSTRQVATHVKPNNPHWNWINSAEAVSGWNTSKSSTSFSMRLRLPGNEAKSTNGSLSDEECKKIERTLEGCKWAC